MAETVVSPVLNNRSTASTFEAEDVPDASTAAAAASSASNPAAPAATSPAVSYLSDKSLAEKFIDACGSSKWNILNPFCLIGMPVIAVGALIGEGLREDAREAGVRTRPSR